MNIRVWDKKSMKYVKFLYLLFGFVLLGLILQKTDIDAVLQQVTHIGWGGMSVVLGIHSIAFVTDVYAWQLTFKTIPPNLGWLYRLFLVRMVGEAFNQVTPLASMGGETLKAIILKTYYRIGYRESGASLVLAKTLDVVTLVVFLCIGFLLLLTSNRFSATFKAVAGLGLLTFSFSVAMFFLIQRFRLISLASRRLTMNLCKSGQPLNPSLVGCGETDVNEGCPDLHRFFSRLGNSWFANRLSRVLLSLGDTDEMVVAFYTRRQQRFRTALGVAFINWPLGALEIYYLMGFLGHPVLITDAWIIDAMAQLVRAGTFFIPAGIGTQEGTFVLVCSAITGNPSLGLAVSVVRRFREILWILVGLAIWWLFSFKPTLPNRRLS